VCLLELRILSLDFLFFGTLLEAQIPLTLRLGFCMETVRTYPSRESLYHSFDHSHHHRRDQLVAGEEVNPDLSPTTAS
jgi:hypothetical protein